MCCDAKIFPVVLGADGEVLEGGWTLTLDVGRVATWTRPDGQIASNVSTIDRAPRGVAAPPAA
jgi:hypothetical protein